MGLDIEVFWEEPALVRFLTRLASFSRVILFDKRGTGLSDRVSDMPSLEVRMDDVRAVMDAAGSKQATLFGVSEGGPMCALFSATYPSRVSALIMQGGFREDKDAGLPLGSYRGRAPGVEGADATRMGWRLRPRRACAFHGRGRTICPVVGSAAQNGREFLPQLWRSSQ